VNSRSRWRWPLLLAVVTAAACRPPLDPREDLPDLSGTWDYTAHEVQLIGDDGASECTIEGLTLTLGTWGFDGFVGRTSGGVLECTDRLAHFSGELESMPVRRGGMVLHYVAFDFISSVWRHDGVLDGDDVINGSFRLRSGPLEMTGRFRAERRPLE
jgi:hypothetical protein